MVKYSERKPSKRLSKNKKEEIIKLWLKLEDNSDNKIAKIVGLTWQQVSRIIRAYLNKKHKQNPNI